MTCPSMAAPWTGASALGAVTGSRCWSSRSSTGPSRTTRSRSWRVPTRLSHSRWCARWRSPTRLLFDELGYVPDFVVADAGTGIGAAVREHFDSSRTRFIPSLWHLTRAIEADLLAVKAAVTQGRDGKVLILPLRKHLGKLSRSSGVLDDAVAWTAWWDELLALLTANGLPVEKARSHRKSYERPVAAALARAPAQVPVSTGGLETLISSHVKRMLEPRRTGFANTERTNHLFDLVVARQHGAFDNLAEVARLLREDSQTNDGYTVALRAVADPRPLGGSYSSLRDPTLLNDLARRRGLL